MLMDAVSSFLPSFVDVGRRRPLTGRPVLVHLLIQRQRQRSISHGQPQHQRLLGNGDGFIAGSTHVLLGVVKALDRLLVKRTKHNVADH